MVSLAVLARLYTKDDLGFLQLYLSTITTFSVVSAFRYELAIVLPKSDRDSNIVALISLFSLLIFTFLLSMILFIWGDLILHFLKATELKSYIYLICFGVFLMGLWQILQYSLIRGKKFDIIAKNRVYQVLITQSIAIIWGLVSPLFIGLIVAQIAGLILVSILLIKQSSIKLREINRQKVKELVITYKKFPMVNTPMVFLNTLSMQLPVFMFNRYFSTEIVGLYMVANRLLITPLRMIGASVSKVFIQAASEAYHEGSTPLLRIYKKTIKKLAIIVAPILFIALLISPFLVTTLLGEEWSEAAYFMQIMTGYVFFQFIASPVSTTFSIINKQEVAFALISASISTRFIAMYIFRDSHWEMLIAFTVSAGLFYMFLTIFIYFMIKYRTSSITGSVVEKT
jgi:O-antigen/teichoic acid export membrane protein